MGCFPLFLALVMPEDLSRAACSEIAFLVSSFFTLLYYGKTLSFAG
jgi:hypothetical protein